MDERWLTFGNTDVQRSKWSMMSHETWPKAWFIVVHRGSVCDVLQPQGNDKARFTYQLAAGVANHEPAWRPFLLPFFGWNHPTFHTQSSRRSTTGTLFGRKHLLNWDRLVHDILSEPRPQTCQDMMARAGMELKRHKTHRNLRLRVWNINMQQCMMFLQCGTSSFQVWKKCIARASVSCFINDFLLKWLVPTNPGGSHTSKRSSKNNVERTCMHLTLTAILSQGCAHKLPRAFHKLKRNHWSWGHVLTMYEQP